MKVAVAAQIMSNSVACSIRYLQSIGIPKFQNTGETSQFIEYINNIFDILNSKANLEGIPRVQLHWKTLMTWRNT
jgi:hypothetical protein